MQTNWIVIILCVLLTMGLLMVVQSQYQVKSILDSKIETTEVALEQFSDEYQSTDVFKTNVGKLLARGQKQVEDLEAALNKLSSATQQKKAENNACQEKMKELKSIQKTQRETKASLDAEVEAWTREINTLKETLTKHSPVCAYVKRSELADKFCGKNLNKDTA